MLEFNDIIKILSEMEDYQKKADVFLQEKNKLKKSLNDIEWHIKNYCCNMFNQKYEESIEDYQCEHANNNDVSIIYLQDKVYIQTDNPRTQHPYDAQSMQLKISDLFKDETFLEYVKGVEVGLNVKDN